MTQLPHLIRGKVGPIGFDDVNEVFRHVERDAIEEVDEAVEDQEQRATPFFIRSRALESHPSAPFGNVLSWIELGLTNSLLLAPADNGRSSTEGDPEDQFAKPAIILTPPYGIAYVTPDEDGNDRYVFQSASMVYVAKVTVVIGGPLNATYDVKTVDDTIELSGMTPINRWPGINYNAMTVGAEVILLATGFGLAGLEIKLFAFKEVPEITDCNQGAAAGFGDSFIGF